MLVFSVDALNKCQVGLKDSNLTVLFVPRKLSPFDLSISFFVVSSQVSKFLVMKSNFKDGISNGVKTVF